MSKRLFALALAILTLFLAGCTADNAVGGGAEGKGQDGQSGNSAEHGSIQLSEGEAVFKAKVTATDNPRLIEAEIVDSDVAFGIYWVLTSDATSYYGPDGEETTREGICVGDTIEIVFSGQVMMSYPPQIAAKRIYKN